VKSENIKILATEGEISAVTGVSAGAQLVTDGFDKLQNGSKVVQRKVPSAAPPATASPTKSGAEPSAGAPAGSSGRGSG
jgi:hypothetical protein